MLGFAKLRGFAPWPARMLGQAIGDGKVWVRFFGKNQLGTITNKNWTKLSTESHKAIGLQNNHKTGYAAALKSMIDASNENGLNEKETDNNAQENETERRNSEISKSQGNVESEITHKSPPEKGLSKKLTKTPLNQQKK